MTDGRELPGDQKHQPDFVGGRKFYCVKPLRPQGNAPSITLTNTVGIFCTKIESKDMHGASFSSENTEGQFKNKDAKEVNG